MHLADEKEDSCMSVGTDDVIDRANKISKLKRSGVPNIYHNLSFDTYTDSKYLPNVISRNGFSLSDGTLKSYLFCSYGMDFSGRGIMNVFCKELIMKGCELKSISILDIPRLGNYYNELHSVSEAIKDLHYLSVYDFYVHNVGGAEGDCVFDTKEMLFLENVITRVIESGVKSVILYAAVDSEESLEDDLCRWWSYSFVNFILSSCKVIDSTTAR